MPTKHHICSNRKLYILILTMLIVSSLFYGFIWQDAPLKTSDSTGYMLLAQDLEDGNQDDLSLRTIGYPLILLLTGSQEIPTYTLFILQLFLYLVSVFLIAIILIDLKVNKFLVIFFTALSILPPGVEYATYVLSEMPALFFLMLSVFFLYITLKLRNLLMAILSGISIAMATLVRPDYQLLPLFITVILFLFILLVKKSDKELLRSVLTFFVVSTIILLAYMAYNRNKFGYFSTSYYTGTALSTRTVFFLERLPDEYAGEREILIKYRNADLITGDSHQAGSYIHRALPELLTYTQMDPVQLSDHLVKLNLILIQKAPLNYILQVGRTLASYIMPSGTTRAVFGSSAVQTLWAGVHFLFLIIYLLALASVLLSFPISVLLDSPTRKRLQSLLHKNTELVLFNIICLSVVIYAAIVSTFISNGEARYHMPSSLLALSTIICFMNLIYQNRGKILVRSS